MAINLRMQHVEDIVHGSARLFIHRQIFISIVTGTARYAANLYYDEHHAEVTSLFLRNALQQSQNMLPMSTLSTTAIALAAGAGVAYLLHLKKLSSPPSPPSLILVEVRQNKLELGAAAAAHVAEKINAVISSKGAARVIVATGASQFEFIDALIKLPVPCNSTGTRTPVSLPLSPLVDRSLLRQGTRSPCFTSMSTAVFQKPMAPPSESTFASGSSASCHRSARPFTTSTRIR